jgi:hypothetical protein
MTLNGRIGWKIRKGLTLELEAFNITNRAIRRSTTTMNRS